MKRGWLIGAATAALGIGAAAVTIAPALDGPAGAAVTSYNLSASGTGLQLTLDGHTLVAATSTVSARAGAPVTATGSGELSPTHVASQRATAATPGSSQTKARVCTEHPSSNFPAPFSTAVSLEAACSSAAARESSTGQPSASSSGSVGSLAISPAGGATSAGALGALLPTTVTPDSSLATALSSVLGPLPALPASGLPLGTVVEEVAADASGSTVTTLVAATLGPSTSGITASAGSLTARSTDTGATIDLLEGAGGGGGALLTVDVGRAVTSAGVDLANGAVTESATAAAVTVTVDPPSGTRQTVSVTPGVSKSFFTGTPLQTTVSLAAPSTTSKAGRASSSGLSLDLAEGTATGGGAVVLQLAASSAQATATGSPVATAPSSATAPASPGPVLTGATTVHTGEPWAGSLPIALLSMSLLAGLGLLARRHLLATAHLVGRFAGRTVHAAGKVSGQSAGPVRDLLRSPSGAGPGPAAHRAVAPPAGPSNGGVGALRQERWDG